MKRTCLSCQRELVKLGTETLRTGHQGVLAFQIGLIGGHRLVGDTLKLDLYQCPDCGKVEFYRCEGEFSSDGLPQRRCPNCGTRHDIDYSYCPVCDFEY